MARKKIKLPAVTGVALSPLLAVLCLVVSGVMPGVAFAQGAGEQPSTLFINIEMGLTYEDNLDQDDELQTTLRGTTGFFTTTQNWRLSFETGATVQAFDREVELTDPFASAAFAYFTRNTEVTADLLYSEADVTNFVLDPDFASDDLVRQEGREENLRYGLGLVTGREARFGTDTQLRFTEPTFSGNATDADAASQTVLSTLRFTVNRQVELTVTGFLREEDTDDAVNTHEPTRRVTAGAQIDLDQLWTADVALGYSRVETETNTTRTSREGPEGRLVVMRNLGNGALTFSSELKQTDDGWRNSVRLLREIETASGVTFGASVGQVYFEEGGSGFLASLAYSRTVRSGMLSVDLGYTADLDATAAMIHRTRLNAEMRQNLTDASSWFLDGSIANIEYENPATTDAMRLNVGAGYRHALSNDWNLSARLDHRVLYEDGALEDRINVLSIGLERRFSSRP